MCFSYSHLGLLWFLPVTFLPPWWACYWIVKKKGTQKILTTSLGKTGIQKPSFLDVSTCNLLFIKSLLDSLDSDVSDNDSNKDAIPTNKNQQTVSSASSKFSPSPKIKSEGLFAGAMAKLKKLLKWPPVRMNQISHQ